jgi:hypothetical protein
MKKIAIKKINGITKAELSRRWKVSRPYITQCVELGLPTLSNGRIDPEAADKWRAENVQSKGHTDESLSDARRRKESALADLREMEVKKVAGDLIELSEVKSTLTDVFQQFRDALLTIPARLSASLAIESEQSRVNEILTKEITEDLHALADRLEGK